MPRYVTDSNRMGNLEIQSYTPRHLAFLQMLDLLALRRCSMTSRLPCTGSIVPLTAHYTLLAYLAPPVFTPFSTRQQMVRSEAGGDVMIDHMWIVICGLRVEIRIQDFVAGRKTTNGRRGSAFPVEAGQCMREVATFRFSLALSLSLFLPVARCRYCRSRRERLPDRPPGRGVHKRLANDLVRGRKTIIYYPVLAQYINRFGSNRRFSGAPLCKKTRQSSNWKQTPVGSNSGAAVARLLNQGIAQC